MRKWLVRLRDAGNAVALALGIFGGVRLLLGHHDTLSTLALAPMMAFYVVEVVAWRVRTIAEWQTRRGPDELT
jgi:hypothetical protein